MELGSLLFVLGIVIFVVAFVLRPIQENQSVVVGEDELALSALLAERDRILTALSELEFDHGLGKVPERLYPLERTNLMEQGAVVLRKLDEFQDTHQAEEINIDNDPLEEIIAQRRNHRQTKKASGVCLHCGKKNQADDRFCSHCGEDLG